jgi:hypothetical protein
MINNLPAQAFWRKTIATYTAGHFEETVDGDMFRFNNRKDAEASEVEQGHTNGRERE